jgi:hypothetical protein
MPAMKLCLHLIANMNVNIPWNDLKTWVLTVSTLDVLGRADLTDDGVTERLAAGLLRSAGSLALSLTLRLAPCGIANHEPPRMMFAQQVVVKSKNTLRSSSMAGVTFADFTSSTSCIKPSLHITTLAKIGIHPWKCFHAKQIT